MNTISLDLILKLEMCQISITNGSLTSPSRSDILCYTFSVPKSILFPSHLRHPSIHPCPPCLTLHPYVPCFTDIHFHVTMILSSLTYSFLPCSCFSLFHTSTFHSQSLTKSSQPCSIESLKQQTVHVLYASSNIVINPHQPSSSLRSNSSTTPPTQLRLPPTSSASDPLR